MVKLDDKTKILEHSCYNKELMAGRYSLRIPVAFEGKGQILKQICHEDLAFQLYKRRDYVKKDPSKTVSKSKQKSNLMKNLLKQAVYDNIMISSDEQQSPYGDD